MMKSETMLVVGIRAALEGIVEKEEDGNKSM